MKALILLPCFLMLAACGMKGGNDASSGTPATTSAAGGGQPAATPGTPTINLTWKNVDAGQTGFVIEGSTDGVTYSQVLVVSSGTATSATIPDPGSTKYYVRIKATNATGSSGYSQVLSL